MPSVFHSALGKLLVYLIMLSTVSGCSKERSDLSRVDGMGKEQLLDYFVENINNGNLDEALSLAYIDETDDLETNIYRTKSAIESLIHAGRAEWSLSFAREAFLEESSVAGAVLYYPQRELIEYTAEIRSRRVSFLFGLLETGNGWKLVFQHIASGSA